MSILQYPDSTNVPQLHVWNNAAFDIGDSEDTCAVNLETGLVNQSLESDGSKENQSPIWLKSAKRDEKTIDMEIKEIEKEITRLSLKLESLRHEKAEYKTRSIVIRGRTVSVKCTGQKQITKTIKKFEDPLFSSAKKNLNQRAVSVGPMEIFSAIKTRHVKQDIATTPIQSIQSGRKSCFFKLQYIVEGKVKRKSGKSLSLSPKPRRTISKVQAPKPAAATTVGSKWGVKKKDTILATINPKKLFKEGEKSARKPLKAGRVVASRYNHIVNQSHGSFSVNVKNARKRSLTENDKEDECNRNDKKRASCCEQIVDCSCKNQKSKSRVKKKWEIPNEVRVYNGEMEEESPKSVNKMKHVLQDQDSV